jgi:hypothetical protein
MQPRTYIYIERETLFITHSKMTSQNISHLRFWSAISYCQQTVGCEQLSCTVSSSPAPLHACKGYGPGNHPHHGHGSFCNSVGCKPIALSDAFVQGPPQRGRGQHVGTLARELSQACEKQGCCDVLVVPICYFFSSISPPSRSPPGPDLLHFGWQCNFS